MGLTGDFARHKRLLKPGEFKRVFQDAVRSGDSMLTVFAKPNSMEHARLGLAISKKHLKLAVDRNRVKRQIRESFRQNQTQLQGLDIVVMARAGIKSEPNLAIRQSLERHWQRILRRCAQL
ncbi:MAG: ribonuclease P protein component [Gammaproteobacteria bacterium]|nr:ribonuclease P protein component [Gammaproteobacteria bacterium]